MKSIEELNICCGFEDSDMSLKFSVDIALMEDWIDACVKLKTCCVMLSEHNSLFLAYMERITSLMVKQIHRLSDSKQLQGDIFRQAFLKLVTDDES
jgi:hypothetical protein